MRSIMAAVLAITFATPGVVPTSSAIQARVEPGIILLRCARDFRGQLRVRQFDAGGSADTQSELPRLCADALARILAPPEEESSGLAAQAAVIRPSTSNCIWASPSGFNGVLYTLRPDCFNYR